MKIYNYSDTENQNTDPFTQETDVVEVPVQSEELPKKKKGGFIKGLLVGVLCTFIVLTLAFCAVGYYVLTKINSLGLEGYSDAKLAYIIELIEYYYYGDVDDATLVEGIYDGLLESLEDPYSVYYTAEEYEDLTTDISGTFAGVGMSLTKDTDTGLVYAVNVYSDSPAEAAGLSSGDIIISADGFYGADMDLDLFVQYIRGEVGTAVVIVYERDGVEYETTAIRDTISVISVEWDMLTDTIGYIYISDFNSNTCEQFEEALADLTAQGMEAVVFDLRYNGGGLLTSVTDILDLILPEGTTVYIEDKYGNRSDYTSDAENYLDIPMAVLTSGNTASAAEIFAGAIRDYEWGTLIGTTTFGKGIVQTTLPLGDGSAIKLTIASYFTPSGECIHGYGITPDIELEYEFLGGEGDTYEYEFDNQIQKAIEVLEEELN